MKKRPELIRQRLISLKFRLEQAIHAWTIDDYWALLEFYVDILPVIAVELENKPGELARMATKFGEEGININYVYGSVSSPESKCLFVFCPEDVEKAAKIFVKK